MKSSAKTVLHEYKNRSVLISYEPVRIGFRYCVHILDQRTKKVFTRMGLTSDYNRGEEWKLCDDLYLQAQAIIGNYDVQQILAQARARLRKSQTLSTR